MCGRTACTLDPDDIAKCCRFKSKNGKMQTPRWKNNSSGNYRPSCNTAPQAHTPVLISSKHIPKQCHIEQDTNEEPERTLQSMRWGLIPSWYKGEPKDFHLSTNNARSDSLMDKASYKNPLIKGKRCVILVEGFFEWKTSKDGKKQPYFISFKKEDKKPDISEDDSAKDSGSRLLTMAGVFDCWKPKGTNETKDDDDSIYSYSIITVDASSTFNWLHHRMPAVLDGDDAIRQWLDYENIPHTKALKLIKSVTDCLDWHPVTTKMNNSRYKENDCTKPIVISEEKKPTKGSLMSWLIKSPKKEKQDKESELPESPSAKKQKLE